MNDHCQPTRLTNLAGGLRLFLDALRLVPKLTQRRCMMFGILFQLVRAMNLKVRNTETGYLPFEYWYLCNFFYISNLQTSCIGVDSNQVRLYNLHNRIRKLNSPLRSPSLKGSG